MSRVVLTDIEGTTSPIAFVKEVLYPLAHDRLPGFIRDEADDPAVRGWLRDAAREGGLPDDADDAAIVAVLRRWITEDRKATPLKALQGRIWARAWETGEVRSPIYPDAATALRRWHAAGYRLAVYSSGSVPAQQRFFGHSDHGDLAALFSAWFDTTTGPKRDPASYLRIAGALEVSPGAVCFLSDVVEELDAAASVGMRTAWVVRPADTPAPDGPTRHPVVTTFDEVDPAA